MEEQRYRLLTNLLKHLEDARVLCVQLHNVNNDNTDENNIPVDESPFHQLAERYPRPPDLSSILSKQERKNVTSKWIEEATQFRSEVQIALAHTKSQPNIAIYALENDLKVLAIRTLMLRDGSFD